MTHAYPQNSVLVQWIGSSPVVGPLRERMFVELDALGLMPTTWTMSDAPPRPLVPGSAGWQIDDTVFYDHVSEPPFTLTLHHPEPIVTLRAPAPVSVATIRRFAELAVRVAAVLQPDIVWVTDLRRPEPPLDEQARAWAEMVNGAKGSPPRYHANGPGGLGLRTIVGPSFIAQIGRERLMTLPAPTVVTPCAWGGLTIDLVPDPWDADPSRIVAAFLSAREHLAPARFFSRVRVGANGAVSFAPPEHPSPGRDIGGRRRPPTSPL
jgi:hypothetical protein